MVRAHLQTMLGFAVVLYLVTHGVSVPTEGQRDLVIGFCCAARAWLDARRAAIGSLLSSLRTLAAA